MGIAKARNVGASEGVVRLDGAGASEGVVRLSVLACLILFCAIAVAQTPPAAPQQPPSETKPAPADSKPPAESKPSDATAKPDEKSKDKDKKDDANAKPDPKKDMNFSTEMPKDLNDQPEYIVGPGDSIRIEVWKEPEVSTSVTVRGDCRITLNLIKDEKVCSLTPTQIAALLTEQLSKFIAAPDVTVSLLGLQSRKVYFLGQGVKRQGGMVLNGPLTIAQALSDAGGLGEFSNGKKVVIQRRDENGNVKTFIFNYADYLKGKNPKGNILLQPGDTIIVR